MELQLNLSSNKTKDKGKKSNNKKKLQSSASPNINFVKNPTFEGRTIAKRRKPPPLKTESTTFSFLNNKPENKIRNENPKAFKNSPQKLNVKETKLPEQINAEKDGAEFSLNITQGKSNKNEMNKSDSRNKPKPYGNHSASYSNKNYNFNKKQGEDHEPKAPNTNALPTFKQISALFKNNPEIPKIGQRHVKPVTEKLFSGKNFTDLNIHSFNVANLEKNMGLKELTVVQQKAIPVILNGRDVLVRSQTGSGKTLAYALPIVEGLQALRPKLKRQDGIKAVIIVPTRELALQTYELFIKLVRSFTWIVPGYLIGGENRKAEKARIRKGFNILIGTPGRICDHLKHTVSLKLGGTRCLILDEADRLLDMGYEKDVASIVQSLDVHKASDGYDPLSIVRQSIKKTHVHFDENNKSQINNESTSSKEETIKYEHELTKVFLSEKRQTVLLSATLTKAVETLAGLTMRDPVFIDSSEDRGTVIADSIVPPAKAEIKEEDEEMETTNDDDLEIVPQEKDDSSNEESEGNSEESSDDDDDDDDDEKEEGGDDDNEVEAEDDSDNEENGDIEDNDDHDDSDSSDQESEEDEEEKKKNAAVYKGLKMFTGIKIEKPKIEPKKKSKKEKKKVENDSKSGIKPESDSDSDYDFSVVKTVSALADADTKIITDSGDHSNPFQNAIKTALAQDEMVIPSSVDQIYIVIPMKLRLVTLSALIVEKCVKPGHGKMLVFMATQDMIDYHCELLSRVLTGKPPKKLTEDKQSKDAPNKEDTQEEEEESAKIKMEEDSEEDNDDYNFDAIPVEAYEAKMRADKAFVSVEFFQLHGSMDQKTRTEVFKTFRKANSGVLLCTDVAARGLDLPHVDCIVQFTGPISATDYVHRVGRTARAGNVGTAIMFLLPSEVLFVRQLEERRIRLRQEDMDKVLNALNRKNEIRNRHNAEQIAATKLQQTYEELVEADRDLFIKACKAFTSWMRFYSTYPREARAAFDRKALHAGHAARALALRSAPKEIARTAPKDKQERPNNRLTNQTPEERKERVQNKKKESVPAGFDSRPSSAKAAKRDRQMMISEFDSGLEPSKKKKKGTN